MLALIGKDLKNMTGFTGFCSDIHDLRNLFYPVNRYFLSCRSFLINPVYPDVMINIYDKSLLDINMVEGKKCFLKGAGCYQLIAEGWEFD